MVNLSPECWKFNNSGLIFWIFYINVLTYPPKYVVYRLSNITLPAKYLSTPILRRYAIWIEPIFVKISSNPLKIKSQIKLNWNPIGRKNILYGGENFRFCKLLFICSFLQKLPCSRTFHRSRTHWGQTPWNTLLSAQISFRHARAYRRPHWGQTPWNTDKENKAELKVL